MRSPESLAEEQTLVRAVQNGDEVAYGMLVDRYLDSAFATAVSVLRNAHDAEDAVQSAFIEQTPLGRLGEVEDVTNAILWLYDDPHSYFCKNWSSPRK